MLVFRNRFGHSGRHMSNRQQGASTNAGPVTAMLMNPFYAITLYPGLFGEHPPLISETTE